MSRRSLAPAFGMSPDRYCCGFGEAGKEGGRVARVAQCAVSAVSVRLKRCGYRSLTMYAVQGTCAANPSDRHRVEAPAIGLDRGQVGHVLADRDAAPSRVVCAGRDLSSMRRCSTSRSRQKPPGFDERLARAGGQEPISLE